MVLNVEKKENGIFEATVSLDSKEWQDSLNSAMRKTKVNLIFQVSERDMLLVILLKKVMEKVRLSMKRLMKSTIRLILKSCVNMKRLDQLMLQNLK